MKNKMHLTAILLILTILISSIVPVFAISTRKLEKKVFIHYKKEYGKPAGTPGVGPDKDKPEEDEGSYVLLAKGVYWKHPEPIVVDNSWIPEGVTSSEFASAFEVSAQEWQGYAGSTLYTGISLGECDGADEDATDGKNEITFAEYPEENVIAVTIVWGYFGGPPKNREIVEFDMIFNTYYKWDVVTETTVGPVMDLQNIATHELGHAFGLGDLYDMSDNQETMYGYADYLETSKRSLYNGDIMGIMSLYG